MSKHCEYFKGKKVTIMGLDPEGRGIQDTEYIANCGALVTATDLKYDEQITKALRRLKGFENITYILGQHRLQDFEDVDLVVRAASVPLGSEFLAHAKKKRIPIHTDETLFLELAGKVKFVGVTGTRGKSTVTHLIHHILKSSGVKSHLAGNIRGLSALALVDEVEEGDIVVMELSSWQLQQFGELKRSPDIAVFTTFFPDHMDYYGDMKKYFNDKAQIFKYQKHEDTLIMSPQARASIMQYFDGPINSEKIIVDALPINNRYLRGVHNKYNASCAMEVAKKLGLNEDAIQKAINNFGGVEGRLQFVRDVGGVSIYNDNNATTPDATVAGIKALSRDKNIVLILGGSDKGLDMSELVETIPKYCKAVVLFDGKGTDTIKEEVKSLEGVEVKECKELKETIFSAMELAKKGDVVLYSPAFASFGAFVNEYDRNDQFLTIVEKL